MNKKTRAALAGLAFFAGCEIGIAIQLAKMIHTFTVRESAMEIAIPDDVPSEEIGPAVPEAFEPMEAEEEPKAEEEA